ncbi:methyl-accepting chemotaxis protein [Thermosporothrix hazakensis]|jgi:methyl-accepting chemotaxis protein|uniref:Methyl-accepting chemotaxis protein n=2 Tax=Thermosporothrix TaxID=768650 RepID=A0A326U2W0_THEHA|nr:methyl-accepting chemotaxis protein [Thermosporothrix hazakensis]PZW19734.1 methyl-accepting chemotaxis protein [Thermosporothrix hazakensis]BBH90549.1 hypothetical protein KTC_53000 [Thermosporothrix sp. COM3]GCE48602.1 hypothetical protein KTH_34710 [Thermosporothrix hazakensis]
MSERKLTGRSIPLRVRFRPSTKQLQKQSEHPLTSPPPAATQSGERRQVTPQIRDQISELLRLGRLLRADLGLDEVLQQIASSIAACTGFRISVINLIEEKNPYIMPVAFVGIPEEQQEILRSTHDLVEDFLNVMRPEFRISQSYFISHKQNIDYSISLLTAPLKEPEEENDWHAEDVLLIPLFSPRAQKLLGLLSLDDPVDGKIPSEERIEVIELFAQQAAIAIDHARLFQEHEQEQQALEQSISRLQEDMEHLKGGDLRTPLHSTHPRLQPVAETFNQVLTAIGSLLGHEQHTTQEVDEQTRTLWRYSELLTRNTDQQARQIQQISSVIQNFYTLLQQVSEQITRLSAHAAEAMEVSTEAQNIVDRTMNGMSLVREATLQTARTMKTLGESSQEINETILDISDLTVRMHHLALNAAIEATRAGERGQGFALIAQELRGLASQSSEAARKIGSYVRSVQHETSAVAHSVEQSTQQVVLQTELVTQTGVALDALSTVIERLSDLIQDVSASVQQQAQGSQLVISAINETPQMTDAIHRHALEIQQALTQLTEQTAALRSQLSVFRIPLRPTEEER